MNVCIHRAGAKRHIGNPGVKWMICRKCERHADINFSGHRDLDTLRALDVLKAYRWGQEDTRGTIGDPIHPGKDR